MSSTQPILVRDRPWSFGLAVVLAPLGAVLFVMSVMLMGQSRRADQIYLVARLVGLVCVSLGGLGAWRARRSRFDPDRRAFVRGEQVAIDLREAALVVLWRNEGDDRLNAVYAVNADVASAADFLVGLNARDPAAGERMERATRIRDEALTKVSWGLPPAKAAQLAQELAGGLEVPLVRLRGVSFVED